MEYILIGKIINTRGIKGELKIKSMTDFPETRFAQGNTIYIKHQGSYLKMMISDYKVIKNVDIITLKNHEDINKVLQFKNCEVYADKEEEIELEDNEYYAEELIGMKVYQKQTEKGEVVDVRSLPQGDYLVVKKLDGKESLVPFRDEFIADIDFEKKIISIIAMEGLL